MERKISGMDILLSVVSLLMIVCLWAIFIYTPPDRTLGLSQKIFYFHVPSAWVSFLAFFIVFITSILYLWEKRRKWDIIAHSSAEVGLFFCTLVILTGPIWAKNDWGVWWVWDARLTTTLILWLIYVGYVMVRAYAGDYSKSARFAAVIGIVGFLDVPVIHVSVTWWRTLHPLPVMMRPEGLGAGTPPSMFRTLMLCLFTFTLVYVILLSKRISLEKARDELENLKDVLSQSQGGQ